MSLVVREKQYELLKVGLHNATISKIEDVGPQETTFGTKDRARIYFQSADQKDKEGKFVNTAMTVTKSLHSKSSLGKLLASLNVTAGAEFDLNDLVGIKCQIVIQHKENEGRTYANVTAVLPLTPAVKSTTEF